MLDELCGNTTVVYPNHFTEWDEVSAHLSRSLQTPVFSLHIHDGDLWMFILFDRGEEVAWFNPVPDYWDDVTDDERAKWTGDADAICERLPNVSPESLRGYLVEWTAETLEGATTQKAYPIDEHAIGDVWQMVDFMKRLSLPYPDRSTENRAAQFRMQVRRRRNR